jgi:hypothetical protein
MLFQCTATQRPSQKITTLKHLTWCFKIYILLCITSDSFALEFSNLNPKTYVRFLICPLLFLPYITDSTAMLERYQLSPARRCDKIHIMKLKSESSCDHGPFNLKFLVKDMVLR